MMRMWVVVAAVLFNSSSLAMAQTAWVTETGEGVRTSFVSAAMGRMSITCSLTSNTQPHQISLTGPHGPIDGQATLVITGGPRFALPFAGGNFDADTEASAQQFHEVHAALKAARLLVVILPDARRAVFPTKGLATALGDCPQRTVTATAKPRTIADILAERRAAAPKDDVVYHQIADCRHERGLATVSYLLKDGTIRIEMTDLCFDRADRHLVASEPIQGLRPTFLIEGVQMYEARSPGLTASKALEAIIGVYAFPPGDRNAKEADSTVFSVESNGSYRATQHDTTQFSISGYLFRHSYAPHQIAAPFRVTGYNERGKALGQRPFWSDRQGFVPGLNIQGRMVMDTRTGLGTLEVRNNPNYPGTGIIPDVTLRMDAGGRISGSGGFTLTNTNPDHNRPIDWARSEWRIVKLLGHGVGRAGSTINAHGVVRGRTTDRDGQVNDVYAPIAIFGSDERIVPEGSDR